MKTIAADPFHLLSGNIICRCKLEPTVWGGRVHYYTLQFVHVCLTMNCIH